MSDATVADLAAKLTLRVDHAAFAAGDRLISGIKSAVAALAIFEGVKMLAGMIESVTEAAVGFEHLHQKLGINVEALQELSFAADVSGSSAEQMQHALQKMALATANLKQHGTGPLADGLRSLKISTAEWFKLSPEERIERLADGFADAGPEVDKTAVAMEILGRSGTTMLPMLNRGGDGIRELRKEAHELGAVMDESTIKSFEEFEFTQKRLQAGTQGLKNTLVTALLPALKEVADGALDWFKANRVELGAKIRAGVETLVAAFRKLIPVFQAIGKAVGIAYTLFAAAIGVIEDVVRAIADAAAGSEALRDVLIAVGVVAGVVTIALTAPWLLVAAGVAAVILIVQDLYELFTGGPSLIGDAMAALDFWFQEAAPHSLQVWWDRGKTVFEFFAVELKEMVFLIEKVVEGFTWIGEHIDDIASFVPGLRSAGNEVAGFLTGNKIDRNASAADIRAGRGIQTDEEAAKQRTDIFFGGGAGQTYGQIAQAAVAAPTLAPQFHMQVTVQGNMTPDTVDAMRTVFHSAWDAKMRELQAHTEKP